MHSSGTQACRSNNTSRPDEETALGRMWILRGILRFLRAISDSISLPFRCQGKRILQAELDLSRQQCLAFESSQELSNLTNERLQDEIAKAMEAKQRDQERIAQLRQENQHLNSKLETVQRQLCTALEGNGSYVDGMPTPFLLESTVKNLQTSIASFCKLFLKEFGSGLDLQPGSALVTQLQNPYITRWAHVTFLLKAWVNTVFCMDFENETFRRGGDSLFFDPKERSEKHFEYFGKVVAETSPCELLLSDGAFGTFCMGKLDDFLHLWPSSSVCLAMRGYFDSHMRSHATLPCADVEAVLPMGKLIMSFVNVTKTFWALHNLCLSFEPSAGIVRAARGIEFNADYMESVVSMEDDPRFVSRVGFMISPGFRLGKSFLKCQIYLAASGAES